MDQREDTSRNTVIGTPGHSQAPGVLEVGPGGLWLAEWTSPRGQVSGLILDPVCHEAKCLLVCPQKLTPTDVLLTTS